MKSIEQRFVVVTGASRGVGRATAISLLNDHGCRVLAVARDGSALDALRKDSGAGDIETVVADIADDSTLRTITDAVAGRRVHALVNNAGLLMKRPFGQWTAKDLGTVFGTNAFAPLLLAQALLPNLSGDPVGHIVNIGSMGGYPGSSKFPGLLGYSASKAALANITECLAEELKEKGVHSNCLCLGSVDTDMLRAAFPDFRASTDVRTMGEFIARFALEGQNLFNGKVLPVASTTP